ncbi:MAG: hypothetical protein ACLTUM_03940 [Christensenellales bacterium]|nr:hypothetical protein [Christensenellaceae bacterium]MBS7330807.1 hypothetical protein [Eubacteriales bacterium]MCI6117209.1 hypothetical protein [Clostridium sp.]MDD7168295.1 hypothetical protein [Clostridium sp.]MDY5178925.1 hypothetical protein [Eubacteriales bacterium]
MKRPKPLNIAEPGERTQNFFPLGSFLLSEHDARCEHCEAGSFGAVDTYADR